MSITELIAKLINGLLRLINVSDSFNISSSSNSGQLGGRPDVEGDDQKPPNNAPEPIQNKRPSGTGIVTIPEVISAHFWSTGSPAWGPGGVNNAGGQHFGTDFRAPNGSNVYAPYNMKVVKVGFYRDAARYGYYVIGTLDDGNEYYSGHLKDIVVKAGDEVKAGDVIGKTNNLNHTHVQLKTGGKLADFEAYRKGK